MLIRHDVEESFGWKSGPRPIIVVVDEPFHAVRGLDSQKKKIAQVGTFCTDLGGIITHYTDVHVLMTSLTPLRTETSGRVIRPIVWGPLEPEEVQKLIDDLPDEKIRQRLRQPAFGCDQRMWRCSALLGTCC